MAEKYKKYTHSAARWFYVWMAAICLLLVIVTFAPSYWLQLPAGTVIGSAGLHLHAFLFAGWLILFLLQSWFAATGRIRHHRTWGLLGVVLAISMLYSGIDSTIREMEHGLAHGNSKAIPFALGPIVWILLFAGFFTAAVATIKHLEYHKRFMVLATIAIMPPTVGHVLFSLLVGDGPGIRPGLAVGEPPDFALAVFALIADLLIIPVLIFDWRTRGRPHKAYVLGGSVMVLAQLSVIPLGGTALWRMIGNAMAGH